ncbi:MAG TPA: alpha/beta hydrolase [Burkholderiaceae bacterium]|nr:alpha/beta hydrolase [Burkholderiaceae bacterium]
MKLRNTLIVTSVAICLLNACASVSNTTPDANTQAAAPRPKPQMQAVLNELAALGAKPVAELTPQQARQQPTPADAVKSLLKKQGKPLGPQPVAQVQDSVVPGRAGGIPIRAYWPRIGGAPLPVVLYVHGGGWVLADLDTYDATPRAIANAAQAIVISTHYRQAPEHRFPAAHEDVFTVYLWVRENAARFGGDPNRIAVMGESAGGNMAATVALIARDNKIPMPVHQVLVYPVADNRMDTPSYQRNDDAKPLDRDDMRWFFNQYLRAPSDGDNGLISLVDVVNLKGLPSATVITAEIDPLQSEGQRYAQRLQEAGVPVDYKNYSGVTHEFFGMTAVLDDARAAVDQAASDLRESFERAPR